MCFGFLILLVFFFVVDLYGFVKWWWVVFGGCVGYVGGLRWLCWLCWWFAVAVLVVLVVCGGCVGGFRWLCWLCWWWFTEEKGGAEWWLVVAWLSRRFDCPYSLCSDMHSN